MYSASLKLAEALMLLFVLRLDFELPHAWYQLTSQLASVFGTVGLVIWYVDAKHATLA